ncbi:G-type lectin S-receptor-like serine/threonine-protein kinase At4g27290 isoform X1 [Lactuca sativa]|uniref:G-type lectin S-receptor-like serine/threonine-protein kinase At4g27290 isoform X1 n=2 Tax=Lactuca sativa TaxID=4236 RepID=UPI000CAA42AF|nr:G-type lectin S-receptor-like serine/threonine-protein kinase At4g27290 isoform X1 [Lactuca sativa]XP_042755419.1 G-type lectin S-receptor-like serine/threonine-protein kinase At4g27290 isoform X1 [Lactuca sativa]
MEGLFTSLLCTISLFLLFSGSFAVNSVVSNQGIKDGETIVSTGGMYELGFFSPSNSNNRYLGIWFKKISTGRVVWIANRDFPLLNRTGKLKVSSEGLLLLSCCGDTVIWSSNSSASVRYNNNPVAQLLDTGNFVVKDGSSSSNKTNFIWQSFDYPGDTLLAGMKLGMDYITGTNRSLTSWKGTDDPSPGQYVSYIDTNGYPQILLSQGVVVDVRFGPWNGIRFSGLPTEMSNPIYSLDFVVSQKEVYYKFELKSSIVQIIHLKWDGSISMLHWNNRSQDWLVYTSGLIDSCGHYGICGPYGSCNTNTNPPCNCMEGFEPKSPEEWNIADWSNGCKLQSPLDCKAGDAFRKVIKMKFPDTRHSWYNRSMTLGECEIACRRNCSCTAYANLDIRKGGSGCLLWFGELMDLKVCEESQDLYIRMPSSLLTGLTVSQPGFNRKIQILTIVLSILVVLVGMFVAVYAFRMKKKRSYMKGRGRRVHSIDRHYSDVEKEDLELNFFSLSIITKATNNFSINNKLGEGGFGPVYKGVLETGQEIAVKQLSRTSEQGYDEFYNEVVCVAKLQHRNLVKLVGYCMDGDERILIYEYMSNKSLDLLLFDETKSCMLDWPQRFCIINGIARGMLYLHQDSRLRIIHRDLKAANILLDHDMNPKISDFGLAREFEGNQITAKTKKVVGTYGYISPEYALHGRFSVKSDVFSFGVLVLEIVSGKKNREFSHEDLNDNLLGHAWRLYTEGKYLDLMSPSLQSSCIISEVKRSIHVGLLCVQNHAQDRPTMSSVVMMLGGDGILPPPKQPAFFAEEDSPKLNTYSGVDEATITLLHPR